MPVPAVIATAAENYRFNSDFLVKTVRTCRPRNGSSIPVRARTTSPGSWGTWPIAVARTLHFIGTEWSQPVLEHFGARQETHGRLRLPFARVAAWTHGASQATHLPPRLKMSPDDLLAQTATQGPPSTDGKVSGIVNFMAIHETYHLGQASYLRSWMGHKGLMG